MTSNEVKDRHQQDRVLAGYRKLLAANNGQGTQSLREKYPQYLEAFNDLATNVEKG